MAKAKKFARTVFDNGEVRLLRNGTPGHPQAWYTLVGESVSLKVLQGSIDLKYNRVVVKTVPKK
jgi:hypothetical protein